MSLSVLLTGGAGFIGCEVAAKLIATGHHVTVLDNLLEQVHGAERPRRLHKEASLLPGDVSSPQTWDALLKLVTPDVIVHLAAETGTGQSLDLATRHGMTNVVGTTTMLDALTRAGHVPAKIVLPSSRAVYGEGEWQDSTGAIQGPVRRTHEQLVAARWDPTDSSGDALTFVPHQASRTVPAPSSIYAATKLAQEHILLSWCAAKGVDLAVLRLQNVYGPGQSLTNPYTGILALFSRMASEGRPIEVYEDGRILRDFVHVEDVATSLVSAVCWPRQTAGTIVDIGGGEPTTLLRVAENIADWFDAPSPIVSGRFRDGDVRAASADLSAASAEHGYQPSVSLQDGLGSLCGWVAGVSRLQGQREPSALVPLPR